MYQGAGIEDYPSDHQILEYIGQFHQSLRHGAGICRYVEGSIYTGEWHRGLQHGLGRLVSQLSDISPCISRLMYS